MTSTEKAETALNRRLERLQVELKEAKSERAQQVLFQSLLVCLGIGEALQTYIKAIGEYAQGRHSGIKEQQETLTTRHADLLKSGNELLARLKAHPGDKALQKEIERAQHDMGLIQKTLRRGANALQRDVAPALGMIDKLADGIKRFAEAEQIEPLKRVTKLIVGHVDELYRMHPTLPVRDVVDAAAWERTAVAQIDAVAEFQDAYARTGNHVMLAIDLMTIAVSSRPPRTAEEAIGRANESAAARLKAITTRLAPSA